ncbi:MAG: hypothetical protein L6R42_009522, partial [Xanthoria sp. 1 TBL-2021]
MARASRVDLVELVVEMITDSFVGMAATGLMRRRDAREMRMGVDRRRILRDGVEMELGRKRWKTEDGES